MINLNTAALVIICLVCLLCGGAIGAMAVGSTLRGHAIEHGCAAYDTQTGAWHWIEKTDDEESD